MQKKSYHILFIPEDNHRVRRLRFSYPQLKLLGAGLIFLVCFSFLSSIGFFYYRSLYLSGHDQQLRFSDLDQKQTVLVQEVAKLEESVYRAEEVAKKIETLVALDQKGVAKGFGPVEEKEATIQLASYKPVAVDYEELARKDADKLNAELGVVIYSVEKKAKEVEGRLMKAYELYQDRAVYLASTPSMWPIKGWFTSKFGLRRSPWSGRVRLHEGIDVAASWGTPVYAPADGVVTFVGSRGGLGRAVTIDHGFGLATRYAHLSRIHVEEGQKIARGVNIANVGNTGYSTGPHLHYEVNVDGVPVDPMAYLPH